MSDMKGEKEKTHITVKIPRELIEKMDRLKGKEGFRSRGEIAKVALRKLLDTYKDVIEESVLQHFNLNEDGVAILDRAINMIANVAFTPKGIRCDYCETDDCRHIDFALTIPEVQSVVKKRRKEGWKLPEV